MVVVCSRKSCIGPAEVWLKFFTLVCRDITTLLITTASLAPQTTSDGSIPTHCTISIVSTLVTPNLATTRMSHCLLHPWFLTLKWLQNSSAVTNSVPSVLPHLQDPSLSPPTPPIGSLLLVVELRIFPILGLDKEMLNSPHFFIPLITPETQRGYSVLTPRPHFLEQNNHEQNDATAANSEVIRTYWSRKTLLPQQTK